MAVITISRGSFSGGKQLAECLATRLGYRCIDREVIVERAAAHGVAQDELKDALDKPPTFLDRFKHKKYLYLTLIQAALTQEVVEGRAVYHGNAGHLLLRGWRHVLRTRIIAPLEYRIPMAQQRLGLSHSEALAYILRMDEDRRRWTQFLYGVNWGDPSLYDVVINLESMDIDDACQIISRTAEQPTFQDTPEALGALADLALASQVRVRLALHPPTTALEVEVEAREGMVRIAGKVSSAAEREEVRLALTGLPGLIELNLDGLVPATEGLSGSLK